MNIKAAPQFKIDMSKPVSDRPMCGFDIEQWRANLRLSKYNAQNALGFRNSNHYNKMCDEPNLPFAIELLIRLYKESPVARGWESYTLRELFDIMYGDDLEIFNGTKYQVYAKVDLGERFTKIFGRSSARHYQWLDETPKKTERELNAYSAVECILSKLKQVDDPKEVLERISKKVWALRGVDLDAVCPVPTPASPPSREKTGRKSSGKLKTMAKVLASRAAKAKALPVAAKKTATPRKKRGDPVVTKLRTRSKSKITVPAGKVKKKAGQ